MLKNWLSISMSILAGVSFVSAASAFYPWSDPRILIIVDEWKGVAGGFFDHATIDTSEPERLWALCFILFSGFINVWRAAIDALKSEPGDRIYGHHWTADIHVIILVYIIMTFFILLNWIFAFFLIFPYIRAWREKREFFIVFNVLVTAFHAADLVHKFAG